MQFVLLQQSKSRSAFTLTELLLVIGIVAVLAALLLPVMSGINARGRAVTCTNNLHNISAACGLYASDNNGRLPVIDLWRGATSQNPKQYFVWFHALQPYLDKPNVNIKTVFTCPAIKAGQTAKAPVDYTLNAGLKEDSSGQANGTRAVNLDQPSKKVLLFDSGVSWTSITYEEIDGGTKYGKDINSTQFTEVHSGKANVLFCDGHVQACSFLADMHNPNLWSLQTVQ